ncbi:hypothetical protein T190115A13A_240019 [Tenacibaculum sp. 190524A02b]|uniref:Uncharacterized protein n=1 Tax=Tenacibaculum vairaonense TaxID=3137860 RepID=A0ABM9PLG7_9FLAO
MKTIHFLYINPNLKNNLTLLVNIKKGENLPIPKKTKKGGTNIKHNTTDTYNNFHYIWEYLHYPLINGKFTEIQPSTWLTLCQTFFT